MKEEKFLKDVADLGEKSAIIHIEVIPGKQDQVLTAGDMVQVLYGTGLLIKSLSRVTKAPIGKLLGIVKSVAEHDIPGDGIARAYEGKPPVKEFQEAMDQIFGKAAGNGV